MILRAATLHRLVILAVLGLAIAYLVILRPLAARVAEEDLPLRDLQKRLAQATLEAGLPPNTDLLALRAHLGALELASDAFAQAEQAARARLALPLPLQSRLREPFQLVEFLNDSQRQLEELSALAQSQKTALSPGLARGFPRFQPELAHPEFLWVQLATVSRILRTAILTGAREISEISVEPLPLLDSPEIGPQLPPYLSPAPEPTNAWSILRAHVNLVADADAVARLLHALTLTPEELNSAGLPKDLGTLPALFLDHLLIRRHELAAPEKVRLELVVSTLVAPDHR